MIRLSLSYCGTLSVSLTAASSPKGRAKRGFAVSARQITICPCIVSNRYVFFIISSEKRECNKKAQFPFRFWLKSCGILWLHPI